MSPSHRRGAALAILIGIPLVLLASPCAGGDLSLHADVVVFPLPEGEQETHFYFQADREKESSPSPPKGDPVSLLARFELRREGKEEMESWQRVFTWEDSSRGGPVPWRYTLVRGLAPGSYEASMSVEDLEQDRKGSVELRFPVPEPGEGPHVSGLLLGTCADTAAGPGEEAVLPLPSHVFQAGEDLPCALLRWEALPNGSVQLRYEVSDPGGRVREEGERKAAASDREAIVRPDVDALPPGRYRLRVDLGGGAGRIRREVEFELVGGAAHFRGDALEQRTVLSYVATGAELQELDRTDDEALPAFWEAFWARRDPWPETATNEGQAEFLRRVEYAIRNLGDMNPGWDTDRGEMYIRYGEPDRRETVPGGSGRLPTQIWYYDNRNLTLVFQDVDGSGHYRLAANRRR